jgi:hypothetical protein
MPQKGKISAEEKTAAVYGYRRIMDELNARDHTCYNEKRIRRLALRTYHEPLERFLLRTVSGVVYYH